jgi:hypothetical protein
MKRGILCAAIFFSIVISANSADYNGVARGAIQLTSDQGNRFYLELANGTFFIIDRDKVGSLAYDQFYSLVQSAVCNGRSLWVGADTNGLGALRPYIPNKYLTGRVYGLGIFGSGFVN